MIDYNFIRKFEPNKIQLIRKLIFGEKHEVYVYKKFL
jgi:hypothetical protein